MRTVLLLSLAAILGIFGGCADRSSPEAEAAAVKASKAWLTLIDAQAYEAGWDAAAAFFQGAVTKAQWVQTLTATRKPLGAKISRKLKAATFHTSLEGAPDGQYVVVRFTTEFANKPKVYETVTQMKGQDGYWRVAGYHLKPGSSHWLQELMDK